jgi:LPXTG-site transpeptidase (sortase) family protein
MERKEIIRFLILRTIGNFLVLFTIFGFIATFGPALYYEASWRIAQARGISYRLASDIEASKETELGRLAAPSAPSLFREVLSNTKEQILVPPDTEFSIVIPKIGASQRIQANVDFTNEEEYLNVLQSAIAHAKGTAYPGVNGTTFLFAHSADNFWNIGRYNAVFYLLKDLEPGDDVHLFFRGKRYNYEVYEKRIAEASEIEHLDANLGQGEKIVLQTCWPPGTAWKRLLVFAKPKVQ